VALQYITSAHSIVFIGLLPLATAIFGVLRGGERPKPLFWLFSGIGSATVVGFALSSGAEISLVGDLLMVAAIIACGLGYAEGAKLSRTLGGWQVISWALILSLPLMAVIALVSLPQTWAGIDGSAWAGLAYVSVFSMLIGFVFWYRGLALGGIAAVGQLQLLQPFFGLLLAAGLLHERVSPLMLVDDPRHRAVRRRSAQSSRAERKHARDAGRCSGNGGGGRNLLWLLPAVLVPSRRSCRAKRSGRAGWRWMFGRRRR
jgi:drug/metabolite transporter (DMT)-like permease